MYFKYITFLLPLSPFIPDVWTTVQMVVLCTFSWFIWFKKKRLKFPPAQCTLQHRRWRYALNCCWFAIQRRIRCWRPYIEKKWFQRLSFSNFDNMLTFLSWRTYWYSQSDFLNHIREKRKINHFHTSTGHVVKLRSMVKPSSLQKTLRFAQCLISSCYASYNNHVNVITFWDSRLRS